MSSIEFTEYYEEFLRYNELATKQQTLCNLGTEPYLGSVPDLLMEHVELYDVVERKYAGFSQIVHDVFYGWTETHPYWDKMKNGQCSRQREIIAKDWTGKHIGLEEALYILILHRVTGSGINYAYNPSGYHNSLLMHLHQCHNNNTISLDKMVDFVRNYPSTFMTSVGYQFPRFPKPIDNQYRIGGIYYLCEYAPRLAVDLAEFLTDNAPAKMSMKTTLTFRKLLDWMLNWNIDNGLARYIFQYAAVAADIADWFPEYVDQSSMFVYGTNAVNCMSFMGKSTKYKGQDLLDAIMEQAVKDTGGHPYNLEDVMCDAIRYVENFCKPGADYSHLDLDKIWNSSKLIHPYGRQKHMLELGLVDTFNNLTHHPTGDTIIAKHGLKPHEYVQKVKEHYGSKKSLTAH